MHGEKDRKEEESAENLAEIGKLQGHGKLKQGEERSETGKNA